MTEKSHHNKTEPRPGAVWSRQAADKTGSAGSVTGSRLQSDGIRLREKRRRRAEPAWGLLSFLLHVAFFGALVFFTPVREIIVPKEETPRANAAEDLSADRIEQIGDSLSRARINELLRQLEALQAVLHNMDLMKEELQQDYDAFAASSAEDAKTAIEKAIDEAAAQQTKVAEHQAVILDKAKTVAEEAGRELNDADRSRELKSAADTIQWDKSIKEREALALAQNALDRAQVTASFAGYAKTAEAAEKLRDAQIEVSSILASAEQTSVAVGLKAAEIHPVNAELAKQRQILQEQTERKEKAEAERDEAVRKLDEAKKDIEAGVQAERKAREAENWNRDKGNRMKREADSAKDPEVKKAKREEADQFFRTADESKRQKESEHARVEALRTEERTASQQRHQAEQIIRDASWRIPNAEKRIAEQQAKKERLEKALREADITDAPKKLENAIAEQQKVAEHLDVLRVLLASEEAAPAKLAQENRQENELVNRNATRLSISEAYQLARELETAVTESYKDIKATQTAIERKMGFEEAQKLTDVARAVRMDITDKKEVLESTPRTKAELDAQKEAQMEVVREADNIVETVVAMMEEAMTIVSPDSSEENAPQNAPLKSIPWLEKEDFARRESEEVRQERLAAMNDSADYAVALQDAAAEDAANKAKDLSELMAQEENSEQKEIPEEAPGSAEIEKRGDGSPGAMAAPPALAGSQPDLLPGNVLRTAGPDVGDGIPGSWMYVNSWYLIGPFPNPGRVNLRRKFPPESVIDLDATYVGKDGKTVRWEFRQGVSSVRRMEARSEIVPAWDEYTIWYAYAEVFLDVECDRWIAIGSDDRSDVWINNLPVWGSSNVLKQWSIDEGFRKVHFRKGRNTILLRLENGHGPMGWSVCISTGDEKRAL